MRRLSHGPPANPRRFMLNRWFDLSFCATLALAIIGIAAFHPRDVGAETALIIEPNAALPAVVPSTNYAEQTLEGHPAISAFSEPGVMTELGYLSADQVAVAAKNERYTGDAPMFSQATSPAPLDDMRPDSSERHTGDAPIDVNHQPTINGLTVTAHPALVTTGG